MCPPADQPEIMTGPAMPCSTLREMSAASTRRRSTRSAARLGVQAASANSPTTRKVRTARIMLEPCSSAANSWDCCPSCRKECSWCLACLYFTTRPWPDGGAHGEQKPPGAFLLFVGWGWGQHRRSSACAIIACSRLSHGLPRLATN